MLPFLSLVTQSELQRNPTVKDELKASRRPLSGLLLTYPVHQAADILFCKADVVPVGRDQLPHVEQTRVVARRFNARYADGAQVFPEPTALVNDQQLILGVDGQKMSKSRGQRHPTRRQPTTRPPTLVRAARTDSEADDHLRARASAGGGEPPQHRLRLHGHCARGPSREALGRSGGRASRGSWSTLSMRGCVCIASGAPPSPRTARSCSRSCGPATQGRGGFAEQSLAEVRRAMSMDY